MQTYNAVNKLSQDPKGQKVGRVRETHDDVRAEHMTETHITETHHAVHMLHTDLRGTVLGTHHAVEAMRMRKEDTGRRDTKTCSQTEI